MASWCMLMTMKYMCQYTCFKEKRPKLVQETSGTMFLRPDLKLFLEFLKTNWFAISGILKVTIQIFFWKNFIKKIANKIRRKFFSKQNGVRVHANCYYQWNLGVKILVVIIDPYCTMTFDAVGVFCPDFWLLSKSGSSYCDEMYIHISIIDNISYILLAR